MNVTPLPDRLRAAVRRAGRWLATWAELQRAEWKVRSLKTQIERGEQAIDWAIGELATLRGRLAIAEVNRIDREKSHAQSLAR